jgi:hypothetical protein
MEAGFEERLKLRWKMVLQIPVLSDVDSNGASLDTPYGGCQVLNRYRGWQIAEVPLQFSCYRQHSFVFVWSSCDLNPDWQVF